AAGDRGRLRRLVQMHARSIPALGGAVLLLLVGCGSQGTATPTGSSTAPVARVSGSVITQAAFDVRLQSTLTAIQQGGGPIGNTAMRSRVRASVLRSLILDTVIAGEASSQGFAATPAEVQAQLNADAQAAGGLNSLETQLASAGGSVAQLQDEIRSQINEQRLEDAFAQQRAADVERQLGSGAAFDTVAKQMSDDTGTSAKGGDLGAISAADFSTYDPAFIGAMKSLSPGQYTPTPVHDAGGYDFLQVYAKTPTSWSVRHILVSAPRPYTVTSRPAWFAEALFLTVSQLCGSGQIHVYIKDTGADPCSGAPAVAPSSTPSAVPSPSHASTPASG
ncbi:MAG TPA: SurA N-terminal domain-containing protein, partial [Steroidobacteraceae bacterium]|nr:SurA N-terminal domain-containing protein [Steroidobacteraceae bacterium]